LLETTVPTSTEDATFHGFEIADYAIICAQTRSARIPIVRQFRPVLGIMTWEFPGGIVDQGEAPEKTAERELLEETGLPIKELIRLGSYWTDTGRLTNRTHAYFAEADDPVGHHSQEPELELDFVTVSQLEKAIQGGSFCHFLHVATFLLARSRGCV
jgi:ADP-ribose pyrophosphatase